MPALEKLYDISLKAEVVRLFLIFIANRCRMSRSWFKIEDSPGHKNVSESLSMQKEFAKLTKFLSFHNEPFSQKILIRDDALAQIHFVFHINIFSIPEVIRPGIDGVGSLSCITPKSVFRILAITFIGLMCLSMETQKDAIDKAVRRYRTCIPW
jgi:hypothetical protein